MEGERLAVFEIRLLLEVFGSETELDVADWRNVHEKNLHDWNVSPQTD